VEQMSRHVRLIAAWRGSWASQSRQDDLSKLAVHDVLTAVNSHKSHDTVLVWWWKTSVYIIIMDLFHNPQTLLHHDSGALCRMQIKHWCCHLLSSVPIIWVGFNISRATSSIQSGNTSWQSRFIKPN